MSTHKKNLFSKYQNNILKSNSKKVTKISFDKCLVSIDSELLSFTNFLSSNNCEKYKNIKRYYELSKKLNFSFLEKEFYSNEYTIGNDTKNKRLRSLILETTGELLNDIELTNIIKYKNKNDKELQFFIKYDSSADIGYVYLIDIYHMVIPTKQIEKGKIIPPDPKRHYKGISKKVKHKTNLSEICS